MLLSVLMPSNRNLANSRKAIETALAFCEKRNALLIVSDNSRDPEKRKLVENASPRLRYIQPPDDLPYTNFRAVIDAAETEFVMMMGDDDQLFVSPKDQPIDLSRLAADCIGIRPLIAVANSEGRVIRVKDFGIDDDTPGARVMRYNDRAGGDNACYHAIYRRKPFRDLMGFFMDHHPHKAGFTDWALTCAMFACGKLPYDPGVVFRYNYHQWDSAAKSEAQLAKIHAEAGLPDTSRRYSLLFLYLDLLILATRKGSPVDAAGKRDLVIQAGIPILSGFVRAVLADPATYGADAMTYAQALAAEPDLDEQMQLALDAIDCLQPGLTARYRAFHRRAMEG